jgi:uncharacterized metal-binding protein YceD (DUF177 family)
MRKFGTFDIPFTGLSLGTHRYQYDIDKTFFDQFEFSEIESAHFKVILDLEKQSNLMILHFDLKGQVETICDTCGEEFNLDTAFKERIIVKFGEEEIEQSEEIWVIPHNEHQINVAELIYEFAHLSLPFRKVHPKGMCNEEALEKLHNLENDDSHESLDPRWEELKKIKKDLK